MSETWIQFGDISIDFGAASHLGYRAINDRQAIATLYIQCDGKSTLIVRFNDDSAKVVQGIAEQSSIEIKATENDKAE